VESNNDKFTMGAEISWDVPHHQKVITIRLSFEMALLLISSFVLLVIGLAHANNVTTQQINTTTAVVKDTIALQSSETALPAASSNVQVHKNTMDNNVRADLSVKPTVEKSITLHFRTKEEKQDSAYIRRFQRVAIAEMEQFNIPASVAMAQGLLESDAGQSRLATKANNHFGVKCHSRTCAAGHCLNSADDSHKDFFIKYTNAWGSFRAHSQFLKNTKRYAPLFKLDQNDYRGWASGLAQAGYATDKKYGEKLMVLIQNMKLERFDH